MPFVSEAQRKYLYAKHPDVAEEFEEHTPKGKKLPKKKRNKGLGGSDPALSPHGSVTS